MTPPPVDQAEIPRHSPLVPTVRYRGRQGPLDQIEADRLEPDQFESDQSGSGQDSLDRGTVPARRAGTVGQFDEPTGRVQTLPPISPESPGESEASAGTETATEGKTAGSELETDGDQAASGDESPRDQWHHKASEALGFHRPKHHLTKRETAGVVVLGLLAVAVIALIVLALTGNLRAGGDRAPSPPPTGTTQRPNEPSPGASGATEWAVGRSFHEADFVVVVDSYEDSLPALADPGSEVAENGQWVLVGITVKNAGDQDATFLPDQQVLVTEQGNEYPNEPSSALKHADFILGTSAIKPGSSQTGYLAFDIPLEDRPIELRLIGRIGEEPATVPLG
jgi:hypothetical protein